MHPEETGEGAGTVTDRPGAESVGIPSERTPLPMLGGSGKTGTPVPRRLPAAGEGLAGEVGGCLSLEPSLATAGQLWPISLPSLGDTSRRDGDIQCWCVYLLAEAKMSPRPAGPCVGTESTKHV